MQTAQYTRVLCTVRNFICSLHWHANILADRQNNKRTNMSQTVVNASLGDMYCVVLHTRTQTHILYTLEQISFAQKYT